MEIPRREPTRRRVLDPAGRAVLLGGTLTLLACLLIFDLLPLWQIGRVVSVANQGMYPTLSKGDHLYVNELAYWRSPPKRGDVVVFRTDGLNPFVRRQEWQEKRVVGLPGETISIRDNTLYVGTAPAQELSRFRYEIFQFDRFLTEEDNSFTVPPDTCFVLGDDPDRSYDSRFFGPVPLTNIVGEAVLRR